MSTVRSLEIVVSDSYTDLERAINTKLAQSWVLHGTVFIRPLPNGGSDLCQAMILL